MTVEELMQPRYEVIADYPNAKYEIGTILHVGKDIEECERADKSKIYILNSGGQFDTFPAIFRPLQWWEKRDIGDLPEYVKIVKQCRYAIDSIHKVNKWGKDSNQLFADIGTYWTANYFMPATQSEYEQFKNNEK